MLKGVLLGVLLAVLLFGKHVYLVASIYFYILRLVSWPLVTQSTYQQQHLHGVLKGGYVLLPMLSTPGLFDTA